MSKPTDLAAAMAAKKFKPTTPGQLAFTVLQNTALLILVALAASQLDGVLALLLCVYAAWSALGLVVGLSVVSRVDAEVRMRIAIALTEPQLAVLTSAEPLREASFGKRLGVAIRTYSDSQAEAVTAWADYRHAGTGVPAAHTSEARRAFLAGWDARMSAAGRDGVKR